MTGRNFDWHYPLNSYLYHLPKGEEKYGGPDLSDKRVLRWTAEFSSVCTYLGSDNFGLAAIDGMNEKGLVVNGLEDVLAHFINPADILSSEDALPTELLQQIANDGLESQQPRLDDEKSKRLSVLRWVQFVLDCFDSVQSAVRYFKANEDSLYIFSEDVPDGRPDKTKTKLHLTLSDSNGDSAIIELRGKGFSINVSRSYNVATVAPRYEVQMALLDFWQKKWQAPTKIGNAYAYQVPGGTATHQRFARASYYYQFSHSQVSDQQVLAQTRSLMSTCATPIGSNFKLNGSEASANTYWCSISEHNLVRYHYFCLEKLTHSWLDLDSSNRACSRVLMTRSDPDLNDVLVSDNGDVRSKLKPSKLPFAK
ncbi:linear amide C-N hydrolase [Vibrio sinaloensis]|uniref:linear amide C-N hydrolase n=1 Tax=Photobacterium sp. (strain ATCC 43367) TaxID=379097 RepID=UPI002051E5EA|nr:linear amide C-N hydrolase [Vibrio sinaloensis]UPQ88872.1 linear amide C-N hydrolase [Vibrio sinaloensis]